MHKAILGATVALLLVVSAAAAGIPITDVLVFSNRAEIQRSGEVQILKGRTVVDLEGLPWDLQESTIRVSVDAQGAKVQRVEVEPVLKRLVREGEAGKLKEEIEALKAQIHDLSAHAGRLNQSVTFIRSFNITAKPHDPDKAPPPVRLNPGTWMHVLDFVGTSMDGLSKELEGVEQEIDDASEELEVLSTKLERMSSKDVKRYKNVHIYLVSTKPAKSFLALTYMVPGPQWFPRYEVRADVSSGKLKLTAYALVRQQTGEDWKGARITLSSADLSVSASLPALATRRISPAGVMEIRPRVVLDDADWGVDAPRRPSRGRFGGRPGSGAQMLLSKELEGELRRQVVSLGGKREERLRRAVAALDETRARFSDLKNELVKQRSILTDAKKAVQQRAEVQEQPAYGRRYQQIRTLYQEQKKALERKDYNGYNTANAMIIQNWKNLSKGGQIALSEFNTEALDNIGRAQRLLKSRKLEKDLITPQQSAAGVDYRFSSVGAINIHSEWVLTQVPYLEIEIPVEYVYESTPVLKQLFYLVATGKNSLDQPLLSGPMAIFVGPDFVGESVMRTTGSGQDLRCELGVDREIEIKRQIERERDTSGFISHSYNYKYNVTIYAVNRRKRAIKAKIIDRLPFTRKNSGVKIAFSDVEPKPTKEYEKYGLLRWDFELEPGKKQEFKFTYGVRHSTKLAIVGSEGGCSPW